MARGVLRDVTRYLLGAAVVIGVARLVLLAIPAAAPAPMAAALAMRDHLAREGIIDGVKCMSCTKPDFGGIRYLPKGHKDSFWPHLRKLDAKMRAEMVVPDDLIGSSCTLWSRGSEGLAALLAGDLTRKLQ